MENKLPLDFKQKWVAALRSGEYKQGIGFLKTEQGYCCLGVACAMLGIPTEGLVIQKGTVGIPEMLTGHGNSHYNPDFNPLVEKLAGLNDGGKSFNEIADYIEANL